MRSRTRRPRTATSLRGAPRARRCCCPSAFLATCARFTRRRVPRRATMVSAQVPAEGPMPRQRHETRLEAPITSVFAALIDVVARGRWGAARIVLDAPQPRPGCEYAQQRHTVLRRGKVLECLRPVKLTLEETLLDRPCRVQLRLKWRLEPLETSSCVLLEASYTL